MNGWKKCGKNKFLECDYFYQKKIIDDIYANILCYEIKENYSGGNELRIHIPEDQSITGMNIKTTCFSYNEIDFDKIEEHARKIIDKLTK